MPVRFAHISDSHIGPERDFVQYGACPAAQLQKLVARLNLHANDLDFVVHTGDVVSDPHALSYRLAREILAELKPTLYLVNGNHDDARELRHSFAWPPASTETCDEANYSYTFRRGDQRFLVLDAVGPQQIDPHGWLSASQLQTLDTCLLTSANPLTVFIHFPAVELDCRWVNERMLIVNGYEMHRRLAAAGKQVRGVFFGHVHRGVQAVRDGVFYCSVASTFVQFQNWPTHETMLPDRSDSAFYNLVTIDDQQVTVRQLWA
jgi:3',5'-cyclic AMP phosphodiesterase CpdA